MGSLGFWRKWERQSLESRMRAPDRFVHPRIKALTVLIVDDSAFMRKVTRDILIAIGVTKILEAPDGAAGLEAARDNLPGLIIVDWEMPLIDGAQFVKMVRSPGEFPIPEVPII